MTSPDKLQLCVSSNPSFRQHRPSVKPPVPRLSLDGIQPRGPKPHIKTHKSFISENAKSARQMKPPSPERVVEDPFTLTALVREKKLGKVPLYLKKRQEGWEEAARVKQKQAADKTPAGMRKLPERQREERLTSLKAVQSALITDLQRLPICCDSFALQEKKAGFERRLVEIEAAIRAMSLSEVYVPIASP
jgi:hypothetical protein